MLFTEVELLQLRANSLYTFVQAISSISTLLIIRFIPCTIPQSFMC